jgi:capsid protein
MFEWMRTILGYGRPAQAVSQPDVRAKFDNAQSNDENVRNWQLVDYFSAKAANTFTVRRTLRVRSRYEASNNPYLFGVANSNADDLVNTGPTLKCLFADAATNRRIESSWAAWADEVGLVEKLRTLKLAKTIDGEGFLILKTVREQDHPVKLYPVDVESDQVTAPMAKNVQETWLDGVTLHPITERPISYTVLKAHPGDFMFPNMNPLASDTVKARFVIHWFSKFRPGQIRGIPAFTTALDLFGELRAYRRAVLAKAQIAANLTAVIETEGPAGVDDDGNPITTKPFVRVPIDRGTSVTLPGGAKMNQYDTGEPATTYEMFQEKCLGEACRPLAYPLNLALGTSQKFNFSSSQLDHRNYYFSLDVERDDCDRVVLDRLFAAWIDEASELTGSERILPGGVHFLRELPHEWHWPGHQVLDPVKDALADHSRISNGTLTWEQFWAKRGYDWRDVLAQQAAERDEIERLGLAFGEPLKKTEKIDNTVDDPEAAYAA